MRPLADEIRPQTLDDVAGQKHLLGEGALLRRLIENGTDANLIFYGPSGTGKTTVANIIAKQANKTLYTLNATTASFQDVKNVIADVDTMLAPNGILLYLDEIQYFNKKQQQSLLEFLENGKITLIASTTENPYFYIYNALLSRSTVFEFKPLTVEDTIPAVVRALNIEKERSQLPFDWAEDVPRTVAAGCGGDVRKAVNAVELLYRSARPKDGGLYVTREDAVQLSQCSAMRYDREGDDHYDLLSALHKSIRGSDPDAAVYYLGRLLVAGDLISPCRRLLCIAAEDIGLAYPQAITVVKSCVDAALQLGLPEARLPLGEAAVLLATAPKSNSAHNAIIAAMEDIQRRHKRSFESFARQVRLLTGECLPLSAGSCTLCRRCTYPDRPCRFPQRRMASMEAYGLLVSDVCRRSGLGYYYGTGTMTYTSCVLYKTKNEVT